jgi:hypothetical protein
MLPICSSVSSVWLNWLDGLLCRYVLAHLTVRESTVIVRTYKFCPHTSKDEDIVLLAEYMKKRDAHKKKATPKALGNNAQVC